MAPNWRIETDYAFTSQLLPRGWAWEFLRRSRTYRAAWQQVREAEAAQRASPADQACVDRLRTAIEASKGFGLAGFVDPARDRPEPQAQNATDLFAPSACRACEETAGRVRGRRGRFDLRRFARYLRLLDAKAAGATIGEVARVFFSDKVDRRRSAKQAIRTAEKMAEVDYRGLLLLPNS